MKEASVLRMNVVYVVQPLEGRDCMQRGFDMNVGKLQPGWRNVRQISGSGCCGNLFH